MSEPAHIEPEGLRERRLARTTTPEDDEYLRRSALLRRGLSLPDAARLAVEWPAYPESEYYTCYVCRRFLYDGSTGLVAPHRLLLTVGIPDDGAYIVCGECDPLPLSIWHRLARWILARGVEVEISPNEGNL